MKRKLRSALTLVAGLSLLAAACGDDDDAESGDATDAPRTQPTPPADGTTAPADEGDGEDVTLTLLIDNTEVTVAQTDALTQAFTELHPNITFDIEQRPGRRGRRQHRQDPARDRRDDRRLLLQLGFAAPGAQPRGVDPRPHRRSDARQRRRGVLPVGDAERQGLRSAVRHGHGRRNPLQQEDLRGERALGPDRPGRSSPPTTTRSSRPGSRRSAPRSPPDPRGRRSCSSSPTSTTSPRPSRRSPRTTRRTR